MDLAAAPLFVLPFLTGLLLAAALPVLGAYVLLRDEWIAALALAQVSAAGALAAAALGAPVAPGAVAATVAVALGKGLLGRTGNAGYGVILLGAWGLSILLLANLPLAEQLGRALFDGQLYFTGRLHLAGATVLGVAAAAALPRLSPRLLRDRLFPGYEEANGDRVARARVGFDLLVAAAVALATASIGVMAAFALVFVAPLAAYRVARGWRPALLAAAGLGIGTYLAAFALALAADQPFGPVLVLVLLATAALAIAGSVRPASAGGGDGTSP
ncbi:MAG: metal ABC transporter permease [Pseudomonadota bacterium]